MNQIWSPELYLKALDFAAQVHRDQKVPGTGYSYIVHLSGVCMEVMTAIAASPVDKPNLAIQCALLHDTIEDAGTTYEQLLGAFGQDIADGVLGLTKDKHLPEKQQMSDSIRRIKEQPREVWMVKLADRITNLQPPPARWTKQKRITYRGEALQIHDSLKEASQTLSARLLKKVDEYEAYCT